MKAIRYYSSTTCVPCKVLLPKVKKFTETQGINLEVVVIDKTPELVPAGLLGVPAVDLYDDGTYLGRLNRGEVTVKNIQRFLEV